MHKRSAFIDIGTNSVLLLIAEIDSTGDFHVLEDRAEIARLGEGVDRNFQLSKGSQKRTLEVLGRFRTRCEELRVGEVAVVGTSALREAANTEEFRERLRAELGMELRVLSGENEAHYSYLAAQKGLELSRGDALVVDVGGGSTELIWGRAGRVERWVSLPLGTVRLTERFLLSDPVTGEACGRLTGAVEEGLDQLPAGWQREGPFDVMVGIAGTFTTLAAVAMGLREYSHSKVHGSTVSRREIERQIALYSSKTLAERRKIPGLEPKRADVILAGALLIDRIMGRFEIEKAVISDQGVRYGLLYERLVSRET